MGIFKRFLESIGLSRPQVKIIIIGLDNSGKTTIVNKLKPKKGGLFFCYEAGPCGFGIHRQLIDLGWDCLVVATSLIPKKAGDRVKTDRRDSMMLARLLRAGELTGA